MPTGIGTLSHTIWKRGNGSRCAPACVIRWKNLNWSSIWNFLLMSILICYSTGNIIRYWISVIIIISINAVGATSCCTHNLFRWTIWSAIKLKIINNINFFRRAFLWIKLIYFLIVSRFHYRRIYRPVIMIYIMI
jgi:hypothetical protein